jgi:nitric oxide synthase oxygenase domain/subunit
MWKSPIAHEIDVAVLHSFDEQGYTIVDMDTVGEQFMTHCKREQDAGRECPDQWSWIGGLTGPTNPTWHKEMRDFRVEPVYEYWL